MEEKIEIRQFQNSDTKAVQNLIDEVLQEYGFSFNPNSEIDEDLTRIEEEYGENFWVALDNGKIVGTVAFTEVNQKIVKLRRMFVDKSYRGKQIGLALLRHAVQNAREKGYQDMVLNTSPRMERAHKFYERFGFKRVSEDEERFHYQLDLTNL